MTADPIDPTHFFVMRHGLTEWNRLGRIQGQQDSPLSREGRAMIRLWCRHLQTVGLSRIYSSDLGRAQSTADRIRQHLQLPLSVDRRLREQDWGQWTGQSHRQLKRDAHDDYRRQAARGWHFRPPGGENHLQVLERGLGALHDIAGRHPGERILLVTHEGWMKCIFYHLAIRDGCGHPPVPMAGYHLHQLVAANGRLRLEQANWRDLMIDRPNHGAPETDR